MDLAQKARAPGAARTRADVAFSQRRRAVWFAHLGSASYRVGDDIAAIKLSVRAFSLLGERVPRTNFALLRALLRELSRVTNGTFGRGWRRARWRRMAGPERRAIGIAMEAFSGALGSQTNDLEKKALVRALLPRRVTNLEIAHVYFLLRALSTGWFASTGDDPTMAPFAMAACIVGVACAVRGGRKFVRLVRATQARQNTQLLCAPPKRSSHSTETRVG